MQETATRNDAAGMEIIRRSFIWAGVLMGAAIVLKGLIAAADFTSLMLVIITASLVDQTLKPGTGNWSGPISAAIIIGIAAAIKLVMEW